MSDGNGGSPAPRFALIGAAGFVARRHLDAIHTVGGTLVAACDLSDAVGVLDTHFPRTSFFLDPGEFAAFLGVPANRVDYVAVCTPSHLHEEHCALALSTGADVILEKPPVLDPGGIERLAGWERRTGQRVHPVLQLRYHPEIMALRDSMSRHPAHRLEVVARYLARRGPWYHVSWKGDPRRSGTIVYNFGIHLFDVLTWIFGPATEPVSAWMDDLGSRAGGTVEFADATVRWTLSSRAEDLPDRGAQSFGWRQFVVDNRVVADYSGDYSGLHRTVYQEVVAGRGHHLSDAYEATVLTDQILRAATGETTTGETTVGGTTVGEITARVTADGS